MQWYDVRRNEKCFMPIKPDGRLEDANGVPMLGYGEIVKARNQDGLEN